MLAHLICLRSITLTRTLLVKILRTTDRKHKIKTEVIAEIYK